MIDAVDSDDDTGYMPLLETEDGSEIIIQPVVKKQN